MPQPNEKQNRCIPRRNFLRGVCAACAVPTGTTVLYTSSVSHANFEQESPENTGSNANSGPVIFTISEPFDGAILHVRHGRPVLGMTEIADPTTGQTRQGLKIRVEGRLTTEFAGSNSGSGSGNGSVSGLVSGLGSGNIVSVLVNGVPAVVERDRFVGEVMLFERFNEISVEATATSGQGQGRKLNQSRKIRVVWNRESFPRYRFQVDDNSFFLRDIVRNGYKSIFDCFYLAMYRDFHRKYGSRFSLNVFNSTPERDFHLSDFPDRYKSEWEDNADWLRLAFHAENEFPDRPYEQAKPEKLAEDFDKTVQQIRRFAGKAYRQPGIIHWGTVRPEAYKTLYDRDVRTLSGYFVKSGRQWPVSFQLPDDVCQYMSNHDGWYDYKSGIVFSKLEMVVNSTPLTHIVPTLEAAIKNPHTAEVIDLLTHEQYFWPFYRNYLPDHQQRLNTALKFLTEHGYKPVYLDDGFYGTGS